ncbi:hypothetical protein L6R52_00590 [Myxococcota bacterium]|nr:hypothetical protein [Myxococcota bacterium]
MARVEGPRSDVAFEDVALLVVLALVVPLTAPTFGRDGASLVTLRVLELVAYAGLWACIAARTTDDAPRERVIRVLALTALAIGYPALRMLLADRDRGEGVLAAIIAAGTLVALVLSQTRLARPITERGARLRLLPLTALSSWYASEELVAGFFGGGRRHGAPLDLGDPARTFDAFLSVAVFMTLPWLVLVAAPRIAAGERAPARAWATRYALYVASACAGALLEALLAA